MSRPVAVLVLASFALACADTAPSGPDDPTGGVDLEVGAHCATLTPATTHTGTRWDVTLYANTTQYRDVAGTDGVVRRQTVLGCSTRRCTFPNAPATWTAQTAISECRLIYG